MQMELVSTQMERFGGNLKKGWTLIDAFFDSGEEHSKFANFDATLRAIYVDDAKNDTLKKYLDDPYTYQSENVEEAYHFVSKKN